MKYTLKLTELNEILHPDLKEKSKELRSIEIEQDGDSLVIDGVKVPVISSFDFVYKIGSKGLVSNRSAIEWIEMLTKDMNDPKRFWSESYWVLLVTLKNKFELKGTKK
jgi:hypothetical protein